MSAYETTLAAALELTPAERLNLMQALGDSLRKPLDAPKPRKSRATGGGAAAAGGGGGGEKPKRAISAGQQEWFDGLAAVSKHMEALGFNKKQHMVVASECKKRFKASWPNPTEDEVKEAVEEVVPEDERMSKASGGSRGSRGSKKPVLELPEGLPITVKKLTAAQQKLYDALSEDDQKAYDAEVETRRKRNAAAAARKATKKAEEAAAKAAEDKSDAESEAEELEEAEADAEAPKPYKWTGDLGKGEREYDRMDQEGVCFIWEVVKGTRKFVAALETDADNALKTNKGGKFIKSKAEAPVWAD